MSAYSTADALEQCRLQLTDLQSLGTGVSMLLRNLSRDLLETGSIPSAQAIESVSNYRFEFEKLEASLPHAVGSTRRSLTCIREELKSYAIIHQATQRLECLAKIQHIDGVDFPPWQRCLSEGMNLLEELQSVPANQGREIAGQFLSRQSPLNAALTLVTNSGELSDEHWSSLMDFISATYGRELSTAIARGKLVLTLGARA